MERFSGSFLEEVRARTLLSALIGQHVPLARGGRGEWLGLCPFHSEKTPSFTVQDQKGFWHCFGCGANGDVFAWMQAFHSLSFTDAVEELAVAAGLAPEREGRARPEAVPATVVAKSAAEDHAERERRKGWELWRQRRLIAGTAADTYLAEIRRIEPMLYRGLPVLGVHPGLDYWWTGGVRPESLGRFPALLAAMQGPDGRFRALHITYLQPDGGGKLCLTLPDGTPAKAKKVRGQPRGAAIRLSPSGPRMGAAEGIETALSVIQGAALPMWAAYSLGNLAGRGFGEGKPHPRRAGRRLPSVMPDPDHPGLLPPLGTADWVICADADNGDELAAECLLIRAARRTTALGIRTIIARAHPGTDFNDMLRGAA